jgi:DAACS family dicarboxylate/amino acid:cation (Na+ or H+) symporter
MLANKAVRSTLFIIVSIFVGVALGLALGKSATPLGQVGKFYIDLIKAVAAPLLFFAILDAILTSEIKLKSAKRFLGVIAINTCIAATIAMTLANVFQPGQHLILGSKVKDTGQLASAQGHKVDFLGFFESLLPKNIVEPFAQGNILGVAFLAVLIGCALKSFQSQNEPWIEQWERLIHGGYRISEKVITWLVTLTPIAVCAVIAKGVGESGFSHLLGILPFLGFVLLGLCFQTFVVYPIWLFVVRKVPFREFWHEASVPLFNAFGINSSLATLPLTLKALDNLGVSKNSSRLAACIGTNLNNDGILLYEAFAVLIIAQALHMDLTIGAQLSMIVMCLLATLGISGVPEAGFISLAVVIATLGYPTEILLTFFTVDWIVARMRSVTNVMADMTTSIAIDVHHEPKPALET